MKVFIRVRTDRPKLSRIANSVLTNIALKDGSILKLRQLFILAVHVRIVICLIRNSRIAFLIFITLILI